MLDRDYTGKYYTTDELAKRFRLPQATICRFIRDGIIKAVKISGRWRIKEADLNELLK